MLAQIRRPGLVVDGVGGHLATPADGARCDLVGGAARADRRGRMKVAITATAVVNHQPAVLAALPERGRVGVDQGELAGHGGAAGAVVNRIDVVRWSESNR